MLALQLKLTPAQVKYLLMLTYKMRGNHLPIELALDTWTLTTMDALTRRGLITAKPEPLAVTEEGKAIARIIVAQARNIVALAESVPLTELEEVKYIQEYSND